MVQSFRWEYWVTGNLLGAFGPVVSFPEYPQVATFQPGLQIESAFTAKSRQFAGIGGF